MGWKKKLRKLREARKAKRKAEHQIGKKLAGNKKGPTYEGEGKDDPRTDAWSNDL